MGASSGISITISVKDDGTPVINKISGNLKTLQKETKDGATGMAGALATVKEHWIGIAAAVYGAERALAKAWDMAKQGAAFEESTDRLNTQLKAFGTNAGDLVPKLQDLVGGQLSLQEATNLASKALAAGISPDQIKTMTRMSEVMGDIKGTDVATAFEELNMALVSGRDKALKAVGIFVDLDKEVENVAKAYGIQASAIDETEKFQIRLNAVMQAAPSFLKQYETAALSHADQLTALEKQYDDLTLAVSRWTKSLVLAGLQAASSLGAIGTAEGQAWMTKGAGKEKLPGGGAATGAKPAGFGQEKSGLSLATAQSLGAKKLEAEQKFDAETRRLAGEQIKHDIAGWGKAEQAYGKYLVGKLSDEYEFEAETRRLAGEQIKHDIAGWGKAEEAYGKYIQGKLSDEYEFEAETRRLAGVQVDRDIGAGQRAEAAHQEFLGKRIVTETTAAQQTKGLFTNMSDAASYAFGQIQYQFASSMANMIVNGGTFVDFMKQAAVTILTTMIQLATTETAAWLAKDAAIVGSTAATAGATVSIWAGASAAIVGFYASVAAGFAAISASLVAAVTAVGLFIMGVLSAIAEALTATVFGIPWAGAIVVGIVAIAAALAATGAIKMAEGGSGVVTKPTLFLAGEAGPESFNFTPLGKGGGRGAGGGGGGEKTMLAVFKIGERQFASAVARYLPRGLRERGVPA